MTAGKCQYKCSDKEWKNKGSHEANCKLNPKNITKSQSLGIEPNLPKSRSKIDAHDKTNAEKITSHELPPKTSKLRRYGIIVLICAIILILIYRWTESRVLIYPALALFIIALVFVVFSFFQKQKQTNKPEMVKSVEELLPDLAKWQMEGKAPSKIFDKKDYIRVLIISKLVGNRSFYAEYDGTGLVRTKNRAYKIPKKNIYGDLFIWDADKKTSINELIDVDTEDAEDSYHELAIANQFYALGRAANESDMQKVGMLMVLVVIIGLLEVANLYVTGTIGSKLDTVSMALNNTIQNYIATHP